MNLTPADTGPCFLSLFPVTMSQASEIFVVLVPLGLMFLRPVPGRDDPREQEGQLSESTPAFLTFYSHLGATACFFSYLLHPAGSSWGSGAMSHSSQGPQCPAQGLVQTYERAGGWVGRWVNGREGRLEDIHVNSFPLNHVKKKVPIWYW